MQANVIEWLNNSADSMPDKLALWDENEAYKKDDEQ